MSGRKEHIAALTGIRAIAAYMVFFHHFTPSAEIIGARFFGLLWEGHVGVSVFFVLSGFLIAFNYGDSVSLKPAWLISYARNRFARIYPIYFLLTAAALVYLEDWRPEAWFMNLSLLRGYFGDFYFYHIGQAWSLTVELTFYALAPFILLLIGRIPIGVMCLAVYLAGAALTLGAGGAGGSDFLVPHRMMVINTFFGRCFEFLLGAWMYRYFRDAPLRYQQHLFCRSLFTYLGLFLSFGMLYVFSECTGLACYSVNCSPLHHFAFPLCAALLIFGLWKERSAISWILGTAVFVWLGKASYIFYLLHAEPFREMLGLSEAPLLVHFLAINLLSLLLFVLLERPLHRLLRAPRQSA